MKKLLACLLLGVGLLASAVPALAQTAAVAESTSATTVAAPAPADVAPPVVAAAPAPAPVATAAEAEPAAAPAAPKLDSGDTAWMLTSTMLVILMIIPGLALFYGGLARSKNMLSVLVQVFVVFSLISILWAVYGYSLAFGGEGLIIGNLDKIGRAHV